MTDGFRNSSNPQAAQEYQSLASADRGTSEQEIHKSATSRNHESDKVKIAGQRTLYLSIHADEQPAEIFLRAKGRDCSPELIRLYDVVARLMSLALQYGAPLEKVGDLLAGAKFEPCGPVSWHDRLKSCTSLPDLIGRHLLMEYCDQEELAHAPLPPPEMDGQI